MTSKIPCKFKEEQFYEIHKCQFSCKSNTFVNSILARLYYGEKMNKNCLSICSNNVNIIQTNYCHIEKMHHIIRISEQCLQNYKLYMSSRPFLWESMKDFANKISVLQKEEIKMFLNSRQSCRLPIVDSTLCWNWWRYISRLYKKFWMRRKWDFIINAIYFFKSAPYSNTKLKSFEWRQAAC